MTRTQHLVDGKHFHLLPAEKQAVEAFAKSLLLKTAMNEEAVLSLLAQPGVRDAIVDAAKSYAAYPAAATNSEEATRVP